jgi:scytalone dehydratase
MTTVALKGHAHASNIHWYKKADRVWKFAGLRPDIRRFECDFDKVFAHGRTSLSEAETAQQASGVPVCTVSRITADFIS